MKATVQEWIQKAEGDFRTAGRELGVIEEPNFDAVCYHSQQCIEKLMKALLIHGGVIPPRTHDLVHLHQLLTPLGSGWSCALDDLRFLTRAAVAFRYPGEFAGPDEAEEAFGICTRPRTLLLRLFDI